MSGKKDNRGRASSRSVSGGRGRPAPMTSPSGLTRGRRYDKGGKRKSK